LDGYYDEESEVGAKGKGGKTIANNNDDRKRARKNLKDRRQRRVDKGKHSNSSILHTLSLPSLSITIISSLHHNKSTYNYLIWMMMMMWCGGKERQKAYQKELLMKRIAELQAVLKNRKPLKRSTTPPHERPARILRVQAVAGAGGRRARRRRDRRRHSVGASADLISLPSGPESRPPSAPAFFPGRARPGSHRKRRSNAGSIGSLHNSPPLAPIRASSIPVTIDSSSSPLPGSASAKKESPTMGGGILAYKRFDSAGPKELDQLPTTLTGGLVADRHKSAHRRRSIITTSSTGSNSNDSNDTSSVTMAATLSSMAAAAAAAAMTTLSMPTLRARTRHPDGEIPIREDVGPMKRSLAARQAAELEKEAAALQAARRRKRNGKNSQLTDDEWERKHREVVPFGYHSVQLSLCHSFIHSN
jgi:hypothetical protein